MSTSDFPYAAEKLGDLLVRHLVKRGLPANSSIRASVFVDRETEDQFSVFSQCLNIEAGPNTDGYAQWHEAISTEMDVKVPQFSFSRTELRDLLRNHLSQNGMPTDATFSARVAVTNTLEDGLRRTDELTLEAERQTS